MKKCLNFCIEKIFDYTIFSFLISWLLKNELSGVPSGELKKILKKCYQIYPIT